ncbi:aspartate-semialdehyde dehydrogenase [Candidatus Uhrbacteria bacterium]|nr:aspartate-semialdehyde dehydrogenase [Candidatus Uhrbacteria bacterium]
MQQKIPVGILGATGMVGQRFVTLLAKHPWFEISALGASSASAGKPYDQAIGNRWALVEPMPDAVKQMPVYAVDQDLVTIASKVKLVFCAIDLDADAIRSIEDGYAKAGVAVVSNNSANRWTADVPMIMPEVNPHHLDMIPVQRNHRGWNTGFIVVKPNCSIQCYVPILEAWKQFEPQQLRVSTYQAISGAGKTFATWPEMVDNVIPYIGGEEEKSEKEPLKIWATIVDGEFILSETPRISAQCIRVSASDGHFATLNVLFKGSPTKQQLLDAIRNFPNPLSDLKLPSAPEPFITYFDEENRPQTKLDRNIDHGMGISMGRLREDPLGGWKCVSLSHNTIRGAAGGAVLIAELLVAKGYICT